MSRNLNKEWEEQINEDVREYYKKTQNPEIERLTWNEEKERRNMQTLTSLRRVVNDREDLVNKNCFYYEITKMRNDTKLKVKNLAGDLRINKTAPRKTEIKDYSYQSKMKLREKCNNITAKFIGMITLTYPENYINDGKEIKRHLDNFTRILRRRKIKYMWILEFQENNSPHFHMLIDKFYGWKEVQKDWYRIVGSNEIKHFLAGSKVERLRKKDNGISYMSSYMNKIEQKIVPENFKNVGRFWGHSKGVVKVEKSIKVMEYNEAMKELQPIFKDYQHKINKMIEERNMQKLIEMNTPIKEVEEWKETGKVTINFDNKSFKFKNHKIKIKWKSGNIENEVRKNITLTLIKNMEKRKPKIFKEN